MEKSGKIYVIGIGPGEAAKLTIEADKALRESDIIVGYTTYVNLIRDRFTDKELISTGMRSEIERCQKTVELAIEGKIVSLISSGDAGVYGMAAPLYEVALENDFNNIEIIPGITAAVSGAAVLGAPVNHDFCTISLSDLLTPWEVIANRLTYAAKADFVIALYNPSSMHRPDYLAKACDILLKVHSEDVICGYVKNIGRDNTEAVILTLKELRDTAVDMYTTVFIGSSKTKVIDGKMITPRGYDI